MDQYCVALLVIVFFIIYMDNQNNMEGFTLDEISAPVGGGSNVLSSDSKELPVVEETVGKVPQEIIPMPKKVDMDVPPSMTGSYGAIAGAPVGDNYMLLSADMMPGVRTTDSNVPMAYPRSGGYGNLGKDSPEFAIGQKPQDLGLGKQPSVGMTQPVGMAKPVQQKKGKLEVVSVYAPWCGWSKKSLPDFEKTHQKLNSLSSEESGGLDISHKLINSETPEGKKYVQENDVKGFPTVHVKKTDESGKTEVLEGPREHKAVCKLLNDHGANIQV